MALGKRRIRGWITRKHHRFGLRRIRIHANQHSHNFPMIIPYQPLQSISFHFLHDFHHFAQIHRKFESIGRNTGLRFTLRIHGITYQIHHTTYRSIQKRRTFRRKQFGALIDVFFSSLHQINGLIDIGTYHDQSG